MCARLASAASFFGNVQSLRPLYYRHILTRLAALSPCAIPKKLRFHVAAVLHCMHVCVCPFFISLMSLVPGPGTQVFPKQQCWNAKWLDRVHISCRQTQMLWCSGPVMFRRKFCPSPPTLKSFYSLFFNIHWA